MKGMTGLLALQKQADELSQEDREGLLTYLIHGLPCVPSGPDDEEVFSREAEMESGSVKPINHEEFLRTCPALRTEKRVVRIDRVAVTDDSRGLQSPDIR
jgi:hypothetical protein